ncbi:MAG: hypothetical protein JXB33_09175, partial [Clostridia bacterium]|nr:hypothetical protein [Clostridia bacterium]
MEIVLVVLGFSVSLLLANTLLLKPLYHYTLERTMISAINKLSKIDYDIGAAIWIEEISEINSGKSY